MCSPTYICSRTDLWHCGSRRTGRRIENQRRYVLSGNCHCHFFTVFVLVSSNRVWLRLFSLCLTSDEVLVADAVVSAAERADVGAAAGFASRWIVELRPGSAVVVTDSKSNKVRRKPISQGNYFHRVPHVQRDVFRFRWLRQSVMYSM